MGPVRDRWDDEPARPARRYPFMVDEPLLVRVGCLAFWYDGRRLRVAVVVR